jgi:hypothetical protein
MNTFLTRTAVAAASVLLIAGCGTAPVEHASDPRSVPQQKTQVDAGTVYDGWEVRLRRRTSPPACGFSPDQVQRMQEAGQSLPTCVRRQQRWFRDFELTGAHDGTTGRE